MIKARDQIERHFARMSNLGFGLKGLPAWVRRLHRATVWITGKTIIHHVYQLHLAATNG